MADSNRGNVPNPALNPGNGSGNGINGQLQAPPAPMIGYNGRLPADDRLDYKLITLNEDNYPSWKWQMTLVLQTKNLYRFVEDASIDLANSPQGKQATAIIASTLSQSNVLKVINCQTAYLIWKRLESIYENKSSSEKQMLLAKFHSFRIQSLGDLSKALGEVQAMAARINALGSRLDNDTVISVILNALPDSFSTFKTTWNLVHANNQDLNQLISSVLVEAANLKKPEEAALLANFRGKRKFGKYFPNNSSIDRNKNYRKTYTGNNSRSTETNSPRGASNKSKNYDECNYCHKKGHWAKDCRKKKGDMANKNTKSNNGGVSYMARKQTDACTTVKTTWIADSGASMHMTAFKEWMVNYREFNMKIEITLGNNDNPLAEGAGTIITEQGEIKNVHYVPGIAANLFSLSACTNNGIRVNMKGPILTLHLENEVVHGGHKYDGVYHIIFDVVTTKASAMTAATLDEWHERFAHASKEVIKQMVKDNAVEGLRILDKPRETSCEDCAKAKCRKASHPGKSTPKADKPGVSMHFDTVGPLKPTSLGGNSYFLLGKDEASAYRFVKPVASKDEIATQVKEIVSRVEIETGNKPLQIVTDNGTEFLNERLKRFLAARGIHMKLSAPYTPQQNGYIEREVRTITEATRALLNKSGLTKELWAEAVNTVSYTLNRISSSKLGGITPYESWFGRKPNVNNLHVFGQSAIMLNKRSTEGKRDNRGIKVRFVGYTDDYNTFRVYNEDDGRVYTSCDITFLTNKGSEIEEHENTIEISDESESEAIVIDASETQPDIQLTREEPTKETDSADSLQKLPYATPVRIKTRPKEEADTWHTPKGSPGIDRKLIDDIKGQNNRSNERLVQNIPRQLYIRKQPPEIVGSRTRSGQAHLKLSTVEAMEDPKSYTEAMNRPDKGEWLKAMQDEINSLHKNKVWILVNRPENTNIVTNRWVLKIKRKPDGSIERYRARLVARGFSQVEGIDYQETYAPVANMVSIRMLFAYAALNGLQIGQFDVKTAFLYGSLDETVYMEQPEGFVEEAGKVCLLKRSLYGLKQAPRQWNLKFSNFLKKLNLQASEHDHCIFWRRNPLLFVAIYVDDGIVFAKNNETIQDIIGALAKEFEIHSVATSTFLGFQIEHSNNGDIFLHQESYVNTVLRKFHMEDCKPELAPITTSSGSTNDTPLETTGNLGELAGCLNYLQNITRPDIAKATNNLCRKIKSPTEADWRAGKRVLRYLAGTAKYGLLYSKENHRGMIAYCDADFAGDSETSRSTSAYVMMLAGGPIDWKCQVQSLITLSSTEAEYVSLCTAIKQIVWINKIGKDLGILKDEPTPLLSDNESAIKIAADEKRMHRTRHMAVQANWPREQMEKGVVDIHHVGTDEQLADMLTKPTTIQKFVANRDKLMTNGLAARCALAAIALLALFSIGSAFEFKRASPLLWLKTEHVVPRETKIYYVEMTYESPCELLVNLREKALSQRFEYTANQTMEEQNKTEHDLEFIVNKLMRYCRDSFSRSVERELRTMSAIKPKSHRQSGLVRTSDSMTIHRAKRSAVGYIAGAMALTNFVVTIWTNHKMSKRLDELEFKHLEEADRLTKLRKVVQDDKEITDGILKSIVELYNMIAKNNERLNELVNSFGPLIWLTNTIQNSIRDTSSRMYRINNGATRGRMEVEELGLLLNTTEFAGMDSRDTTVIEIKRVAQHSVGFAFQASIASKDTFIYAVKPFKHWRNLTGDAYFVDYAGPLYLIHNSTANCTKGINRTHLPSIRVVTERCTKENYYDPHLNNWQESDPGKTKDYQYEDGENSLHVYCYFSNITIEGQSYECPTYVFQMHKTYSFGWEDFYHHATKVDLHGSLKNVDDDGLTAIEQRFAGDDLQPSIVANIQRLQKKLEENHAMLEHSIIIEQYGSSWWAAVLGAFLTLLTVVMLAVYLLRTHITRRRIIMNPAPAPVTVQTVAEPLNSMSDASVSSNTFLHGTQLVQAVDSNEKHDTPDIYPTIGKRSASSSEMASNPFMQ